MCNTVFIYYGKNLKFWTYVFEITDSFFNKAKKFAISFMKEIAI